jgi:hypothetical protein
MNTEHATFDKISIWLWIFVKAYRPELLEMRAHAVAPKGTLEIANLGHDVVFSGVGHR